MADNLLVDMGSVFSVLPRALALQGSREVLERYMARPAFAETELPWADFNRVGGFVRGGITFPNDLSTRFVAGASEHPDIASLVDSLGDAAPEAGRIVHLRGSDCFHWYVPLALASSDRASGAHTRGLVVSFALLVQVVDMFDADRGITRAEKRLLFQLVCGATLREAADADGLSFETKRVQVKSLSAKLRCRGQTELVRRTMGQLIQLLNFLTDGDSPYARTTETFVRQHLPSGVRLIINRVADDRLLRTLECGPPDGRPVLVVHGMLYPLLFINGVAECERLGVRLIMPVRSGYLDDQSAAALYGESEPSRDLDDVASLISRFGDGALPVVGHSMGASWALRFAREHPARVASLILLSPHFAGDRHAPSRFAVFLGGLKSLADRPGIIRYVAWQFRKYYVDTRMVERVLCRLFEDSQDDVAVLAGERGGGPVYDWFAASYRSSIVGIAEDMAAGMRNSQAELAELPCPTTIIYGPEDPLAMFVEHVRARSPSHPIRLKRLPHGGHLTVASHAREVWDDLLSSIDDETF